MQIFFSYFFDNCWFFNVNKEFKAHNILCSRHISVKNKAQKFKWNFLAFCYFIIWPFHAREKIRAMSNYLCTHTLNQILCSSGNVPNILNFGSTHLVLLDVKPFFWKSWNFVGDDANSVFHEDQKFFKGHFWKWHNFCYFWNFRKMLRKCWVWCQYRFPRRFENFSKVTLLKTIKKFWTYRSSEP